MADYNIKADITANTKGYEAGIKKAQESTKKFSTSLSKVIQGLGKNGLVGAMGSIGLASAGLSATLGAVVKIAKQVSQTIGECTEAYKKQLIAERQLETAINNNPLVTGSAKKRLTEFASEMQKVSNYGDEELIPMMANLVSLGRTEEETMKIMAVAMDMSASGSMSLDTAITQLNATLNGNIGRLGQQNAELKGLTEEELKSGKAIDILGEKFKGLSQATLDTSKQLKNIKGDFKEAIGEFTLPTSDMWNKFWIGFYDKGISVIKQFDEFMDKTIIGKGIAEELIKGYKSISDERQKVLYLEDNIHALSESQIVALQKHLESTKNRNKEQEELLRKVKMEVEARTYLAKVYAEMEEEEAQRQKTEEEQLAIENEIAILKGQYLEKMAEQERKWKNIKDVTGEQVSNEEKIKFYQDSLVDLMTKAGGQITTNNQLYKDQMAIIQSLMTEEEKGKADISAWEDKLIAQQIERYQIMKDNELKSTDNASKQYEIEHKYGKLILDLKMQQIEREKEAELSKVANTENEEEARLRILEYYSEKERLLRLQNVVVVKQQNEQIKKNWKDALKDMLENTKASVSKIGAVFGKIAKTIGSAFGGIKNILTKVFDFNPDDALDGLLKIEDKILTFFVETVPKLPAFFKSALQSISVLLANIKLKIDSKKVKDFVTDFVRTLAQNLPVIIKTGAEITRDILVGLIQGISENASTIIDLMFMIAKEIIKILPDILIAIIKAIPSILGSLVSVVAEVVKEIAKWVANMIIDGINLLLDGISSVWTWIPGTKGIPHIPHFANGTDNAQRGLALVGEAGPELVRFNGGEKVLNNHNTQKALAGLGNNGNTFNVTFNNLQDTSAYAMMSQLRQYNRQLSINGVI